MDQRAPRSSAQKSSQKNEVTKRTKSKQDQNSLIQFIKADEQLQTESSSSASSIYLATANGTGSATANSSSSATANGTGSATANSSSSATANGTGSATANSSSSAKSHRNKHKF